MDLCDLMSLLQAVLTRTSNQVLFQIFCSLLQNLCQRLG